MPRNDPSPPYDPQQHRLYEWERAFVESKTPGAVMSRQETQELARRASGLLGIREPRIRFLPLNVSCRANMRTHEIEIADWGRTKPTLLHEIGHLATIREVMAGDAPHGKAFLSTVIALYARFIPLPIDYLIETAVFRGLILDEPRARGPIGNETREGFFPGVL